MEGNSQDKKEEYISFFNKLVYCPGTYKYTPLLGWKLLALSGPEKVVPTSLKASSTVSSPEPLFFSHWIATRQHSPTPA